MQLQTHLIQNLLDNSLQEDYGIRGDITSEILLNNQEVQFTISPRHDIILCGTQIADYYLSKYSSIQYDIHFKDSNNINKNEVIISGHGLAKEILLLERVILNYLQHLSGIATLTNLYVKQTIGTKAKIYDTRKTIPMLRHLQKYAVRCGGGNNHRLALDSSVLIKDNHIAIYKNLSCAVKQAKIFAPHYTKIEVECDTLSQVHEAIDAGADIIMLDNMTVTQIASAVKIIDNKALVEASGNVNIENIAEIAATGVDIISVGKITHSAKAVDIGLDIIL